MDFKTLLQKIYGKFDTAKFKAKDIYEFYVTYFPRIILEPGSQSYLASPESQKHHAVVDLRKLCNMGLLCSRNYKGRWQEYWITRKGYRYLKYINRPSWMKILDNFLELEASLSPEEVRFVQEYVRTVFGRVEAEILRCEVLAQQKYSMGMKKQFRILASLGLARKYSISPARHAEIVERLTGLLPDI